MTDTTITPHSIMGLPVRPDPSYYRRQATEFILEPADKGSFCSTPELASTIIRRLVYDHDSRLGPAFHWYAAGIECDLGSSTLTIFVYDMENPAYGGIGRLKKEIKLTIEELSTEEKIRLEEAANQQKIKAAYAYAEAVDSYNAHLRALRAAHELWPESKPVISISGTSQAQDCMCQRCQDEKPPIPSSPVVRFMPGHGCGNKRCPKSQDHRFKCTNSNSVGQVGELEDYGTATDQDCAPGNAKDRH